MAEFRQLPDEVYREAGEVVRAVSGSGPRPEVEVMPGFESMVAGAIVVLGRAAPHALYDSRPSLAEDWVREGSNEWRALHTATAHAIDGFRRHEGIESSRPAEVMTHIVSDVLTQTSARRMEMAVKDSNPAFSKALDQSQLSRVESAREDNDEARSIHAESYGNYSDLSRWRQEDLSRNLVAGSNLSAEMKAQIAAVASLIERQTYEIGPRVRLIDERLADFMEPENSRPLFQSVTVLEHDRVVRLTSGEEKPHGKVDHAILAHSEIVGDSPASQLARAQAMADMEVRTPDGGVELKADTASEIAIRIEAHRLAIEGARKRAYDEIDWPNPLPSHVEQVAWGTSPHRFDPETQVGLFQAIENGDRVPGLVAMQLGLRAEEMLDQAIQTGIDHDRNVQVKEAGLNSQPERVITYEGIDRSHDDADLINNLYRPGDRVRIDEKINVAGVDREALKEQLGSEPLEISKTVVRGEERENFMGGINQVSIMQYEFKGHEGRFPAPSFQHENGDEHAYGMVAVVDNRLWLVPLDENLISEGSDARVTGPAREIVATSETVDPQENARRFESMKQMLTEDGPSAGEFAYRPNAFGAKEGPIDLIAAPWMSGTSDSEREVGLKAISEQSGPKQGLAQAVAASMGASHSR